MNPLKSPQMKEFKKFISRGNVVDLAVGLILATYFGAIVKSLVNDVVMPPVGMLLGGVDFSDLKIISEEIIPVKQVRERLSQRWNIKFSSGQVEGEDVEELMHLARKNQGNCRLIFHLPNQGSVKPLKIIAHNIMVTTDSLFIQTLRTKYGKENVWVD